MARQRRSIRPTGALSAHHGAAVRTKFEATATKPSLWPHAPSSMLQTLNDVEEEISRMEGELLRLKGLRNDRFLAISNLPPEILSLIFEHLSLLRSPHSSRNYHACFAASQVCRSWRNIALNTPRIWGVICNDFSERWMNLLLKRSRSAPLIIQRGNMHNSLQMTAALLAPPYTERLKEIDVNIGTEQDHEHVTRLLNSPTPLLTMLSICLFPSPSVSGKTYHLGNKATRCSIEVLHLFNCSVDFDSPFSQLQELVIHFGLFHMDAAMFFSVRRLLVVLQCTPKLRSLYLSHVLIADTTPSNLVVHLPHLTHFRLTTMHASNLSIFNNMVMPSLTTVQICDCAVGAGPLVANIAPVFAVLPPASTSPRLAKLIVGIEGVQYNATLKVGVASPPFELDIEFGHRGDLRHILDLCVHLPSSQPRVLSLTCGAVSSEYIKGLCRPLLSVDELHVSALNDALLVLDDTPNVPTPFFSLPALRRIVLIPELGIKYKSRMLPRFRRMLQARKHINAPIEHLKLVNVELTPKEKEALAKLVDLEFQFGIFQSHSFSGGPLNRR